MMDKKPWAVSSREYRVLVCFASQIIIFLVVVKERCSQWGLFHQIIRKTMVMEYFLSKTADHTVEHFGVAASFLCAVKLKGFFSNNQTECFCFESMLQ